MDLLDDGRVYTVEFPHFEPHIVVFLFRFIF